MMNMKKRCYPKLHLANHKRIRQKQADNEK